MSFYFLQINRTAAVPPRIFFFFSPVFLVQFFLTCVEKYHLQRMIKVTGTLHHASHFAAAKRIPLILEKLKNTERGQRGPSKVLFFPPLFFSIFTATRTHSLLFTRGQVALMSFLTFFFFSYSTFKDRFVQEKKEEKKHPQKVLNLSTAAAWKRVAVLTDEKALCQTLLTLTLVRSSVGLERRFG